MRANYLQLSIMAVSGLMCFVGIKMAPSFGIDPSSAFVGFMVGLTVMVCATCLALKYRVGEPGSLGIVFSPASAERLRVLAARIPDGTQVTVVRNALHLYEQLDAMVPEDGELCIKQKGGVYEIEGLHELLPVAMPGGSEGQGPQLPNPHGWGIIDGSKE